MDILNKSAYIGLMVSVMLLCGCSTQKNTWASRTFHQTTTRYNIYFNGNIAYGEGLKEIATANMDNYAEVIPMYPASNHNALQAGAAKMDRTIEKCRKCIKLHSIKKRPKIDPKKRSDPKYQAWLQREEFNKEIDKAWLLLAEAEFHKGDFLGAVGTFNYIINHYGYDKDMVACCQLWVARAYSEMGWMYEAEDMLARVNADDLSDKHASLYAAHAADLKVKTENYKEAIPLLKRAIKDEKKSGNLARFNYLLGQLYERVGNKDAAHDAYKEVVRLSPKADMDFNARLRKSVLSKNSHQAVKQLLSLAKESKNKEQLDLIYSAIGDVYIHDQDTTEALKYYHLAIDSSKVNVEAKGVILVNTADIHYNQQGYTDAQPLYQEATTIISAEDEDYKRIANRAETLDELVKNLNVVSLQDSLQHLATLSDEEQLAVVEKVIKDLEEAEKAAAAREEAEKRRALEGDEDDLLSVNTSNMLGGGGASAAWYFYNTSLLQSGKQTFRQKWGTRPLEDNWRRTNKMVTASFEEEEEEDEEGNEQAGDSTGVAMASASTEKTIVTNTKDPQFYLQQIPKSEEQLAQSNEQIADALYAIYYVYHDKIEDEDKARKAFEELQTRYPNDSKLVEIYYSEYLIALKAGDKDACENWKNMIVARFPKSKQAEIVSTPGYFDKLQRTLEAQDKLYEDTYDAFREGEYGIVKQRKIYTETTYPQSKHMPRTLFLNAIAVAKTEGQDAFIDELIDLVNRYPESEVGAMAKDMLAMMNQGMESQLDSMGGSLAGRRENQLQEDEEGLAEEKALSAEKNEPSLVILSAQMGEGDLNEMLYEVALFNFSQFLIKDYDLRSLPHFLVDEGAVVVAGHDSYDAAQWYVKKLLADSSVRKILDDYDVNIICITETNYRLLNTYFSIREYRKFEAEHLR